MDKDDGVSMYDFFFDQSPPKTVTCKYCGEIGYKWKNFGSDRRPRWRLIDNHGDKHKCDRDEVDVACKNCGQDGLRWRNSGSSSSPKWKLVKKSGGKHKCPPWPPWW